MIQIGGDRAWKQFVKGDVVISFHWVNGEPAMCLCPKRQSSMYRGAYIICLSAAWKYAKNDGYPTPELIPKCIEAARVMGMDTTKDTVRRIADAILDCLPELVKMPPEPTKKQMRTDRPIGEMTLRNHGKIVHQGEVYAPTREELVQRDKLHSYGD